VTGARERKRAERQKRKRRAAGRSVNPAEAQATAGSEAPQGNGGGARTETFQERMARRYEERNAEARGKLEPLKEGERPGAVTVGAVVSAILALIFTASTVIAATGAVDVSGEDPSPVGIGFFAAALWLMTWGMWKARYWAVLGFQVLLLIALIVGALALVTFSTVFQLLASLLLLAGSGSLFYFMIRALGRIQMPRPPGTE
jgi:hypothetical protein